MAKNADSIRYFTQNILVIIFIIKIDYINTTVNWYNTEVILVLGGKQYSSWESHAVQNLSLSEEGNILGRQFKARSLNWSKLIKSGESCNYFTHSRKDTLMLHANLINSFS